jgi:hypothetical protein
MDKLSKPVFNDEEYKALLDLMNFLTVTTKLREHSHCTDEKFINALQMVNDCLQESEYVNKNRHNKHYKKR